VEPDHLALWSALTRAVPSALGAPLAEIPSRMVVDLAALENDVRREAAMNTAEDEEVLLTGDNSIHDVGQDIVDDELDDGPLTRSASLVQARAASSNLLGELGFAQTRRWGDIAKSGVIVNLAARFGQVDGLNPLVAAATALAAHSWISGLTGFPRELDASTAVALTEVVRRATTLFEPMHAFWTSRGRSRISRTAMESVAVVLARGDAAELELPPIPDWWLASWCLLAEAVDSGMKAWKQVDTWLFGDPYKDTALQGWTILELDDGRGFGLNEFAARRLLAVVAMEEVLRRFPDRTCGCQRWNPDSKARRALEASYVARSAAPCESKRHRLHEWRPGDPTHAASLRGWFLTWWRGAVDENGPADTRLLPPLQPKAVMDGALRRIVLGNLDAVGIWGDADEEPQAALRAGDILKERCEVCKQAVFPTRRKSASLRAHGAGSPCEADASTSARYHGDPNFGLLLLVPAASDPRTDPVYSSQEIESVHSDTDRDAPASVEITTARAPFAFLIGPVQVLDDGTVEPDTDPARKRGSGVKAKVGHAFALLPSGSAFVEFSRHEVSMAPSIGSFDDELAFLRSLANDAGIAEQDDPQATFDWVFERLRSAAWEEICLKWEAGGSSRTTLDLLGAVRALQMSLDPPDVPAASTR
jgi:hypothetical protein